jgi:hypothetical protein
VIYHSVSDCTVVRTMFLGLSYLFKLIVTCNLNLKTNNGSGHILNFQNLCIIACDEIRLDIHYRAEKFFGSLTSMRLMQMYFEFVCST